MKKSNIGFGVFLLSIGIIWALINMGFLSWSIFESLFTLWPLILVMVGVNVIFRNNEIVKAITWVVFLIILLVYSYFAPNSFIRNGQETVSKNIVVEKTAETTDGYISFSLGGTSLNIDSGSAKLVEGTTEGRGIDHDVKYKDNDKTAVIDIKNRKTNIIYPGSPRTVCDLSLNNDVVWDFNIDAGAFNGDLDMTDLKVKHIDIDTGAAKLKMLFGNKYEMTTIKIDAGASKFECVVPEDAGVRVRIDGAINDTNLKELGWKKDSGYYISPNYDQAASKLDFDVDMGVGKFDVIVQK